MSTGQQASRPASKLVDADGAPLDADVLGYVFQPMSPELFDDPVCGAALRRLADEDPIIIDAVADVDRTQIRDCMEGTPSERLRCAEVALNDLLRLACTDLTATVRERAEER